MGGQVDVSGSGLMNNAIQQQKKGGESSDEQGGHRSIRKVDRLALMNWSGMVV